jgi:hypothetical protein
VTIPVNLSKSKLKNYQGGFDDCAIAYFISPHGYGHAARASAVMAAMYDINPSIKFEIFTTIPGWFFQQSLSGSFAYHSLLTDIGMVQETPLRENLPETLKKLNNFLPYVCSQIEGLSRDINKLKCQLVLCDISPMGIAVAQKARVPSVLIENFTWDWVYENYLNADFPANQHVDYLRKTFNSVSYHIQTEPVCYYKNADLTTIPISRKPGTPSQKVRQRLGIPDRVKAVMITMGGIPEKHTLLNHLTYYRDIYFIIPGGSQTTRLVDNLVLLPHRSDFFHPDLINACNAVIGKLGYSTLAEIYYAGVPYGYIPRSSFKESEILEAFVKEQMSGCAISETQYKEGSWISFLPDILALPVIKRSDSNGAEEAAQFIYKVLSNDESIGKS